MPRFYMHIEDWPDRIEDLEGSELPDHEAARREVLSAARQLWAAAILDGRDLSGRSFIVTDETGNVVLTMAFKEALPPGLIPD